MSFRSVPPPVTDFSRLSLPPQSIIELNDRVTLHTVHSGKSKATQISLLWNYGNANIPHSYVPFVLPQIMRQGTETMSSEMIDDRIDFLGSFLSSDVGSAYSSFQCLCLNSFRAEMLDIIADIFMHPSFKPDTIEALRRKALAKYDVQNTHSKYVAQRRLIELVSGPEHPYYHNPTRQSIESFSRQQLVDAWHNAVSSSRIHLIVGGEITSGLIRLIEDFASRICPDESVNLVTPHIVPFNPATPGEFRVDMPASSQSSIGIAIPTIPRSHPDYIPLRIGVIALGGYFGSRLMTVVREKMGLTYGISASLHGSLEGSYINISSECDSGYVESVLRQVDIEIDRLASTPMPEDEFRRLRSYYMTIIASTLETFKSVADYYQSQITIGIPVDYYQRQQDVLESITPKELSDIIAKYIIPSQSIKVIAG